MDRRSGTRTLVVLAVLLAVIGCQSSPSTSPGATGPRPSSGTGQAPTGPPGSAGPSSGTEAKPVPPADFADLVDRRVEAGEASLEDALLEVLALFAGEREPGSVPGSSDVVRGTGTGIVRMARQYVASGGDPAKAEEIRRLLSIVAPTRADLDPWAQPRPEGAGRAGPASATNAGRPFSPSVAASEGPGVRPPLNVPRGCSTPSPAPSGSSACLTWDETTVAGVTVRTYSPRAWLGDTTKEQFYDLALGGVTEGVATYSGVGLRADGEITVVFVDEDLPPDPDGGETLADADEVRDDCGIIVYPALLVATGAAYGEDGMRQVLAHEAFHCYQYWNWQSRMNLPRGTTDWWVEGTAEYFSNVAFPDAEAENEWLDMPDSDPGLVKQDYGNVFFFQHLANQGSGPRTVLDVIEATPTTGGLDAQVDTLRGLPDIESSFHDYAEDLVAHQVMDLDGDTFNTRARFQLVPEITAAGELMSFDTIAFAVHRFATVVPEGHRATLDSGLDGTGNETVAPGNTGATFSGAPDVVDAACLRSTHRWVVTSTESGVGYLAEAEEVIEAECDRCLVGDWQLDNATYEQYLPDPAEGLTYLGTTGLMLIGYGADGSFSGGFDGFGVAFSSDSGEAEQTVELRFDGTALGTWSASGGVLSYGDVEFDFSAKVRVLLDGEDVGGSDVPFSRSSFPVFGGSTIGYACTETELRFHLLDAPDESLRLEALRFVRTSPAP